VITLSGYVYKDEERIEAEKIARKVTGVLEVANDIQVRPHTGSH
jgi:osmotically-inducible protein OsmY